MSTDRERVVPSNEKVSVLEAVPDAVFDTSIGKPQISDTSGSSVSNLRNVMGNEQPSQSAISVKLPDSFDFQKPESWKSLITRFGRFMSVTGLGKKSEKEKLDLLRYSMGDEAEDVRARVLPVTQVSARETNSRQNYDIVKQRFKDYFAPKENVI